MHIKKEQLKIDNWMLKYLSFGLSISFLPPAYSYAQNVEYNQNESPNIVWFIAEDITQQLSVYGDSTAFTPNIDRLAREGVVYKNCFSVSPVCAPSRSALITSTYPTSVGTHNMRVNWDTPEQIENYWVPIPNQVKAFTQYLREAGYFCTNNAKQDYNFNVGYADWDMNGENAEWRKRNNPEQPFFSVFTSNTTHESRIWKHKDHQLRVTPEDVQLPPYYPDVPEVRQDVARCYSNIEEMDAEVGLLLKKLEEDNLLEKTIFIFFGDNGGPLPRQKRELYDGGIKVPLIIRFPGKKDAGKICNDMVSFVDFGVSMLSLADLPIPGYYHGIPFLGKKKGGSRKYVFAARDRLDRNYDMVRAVRDKRYKYIRNFNTETSCYLNVEYRLQLDMMRKMLAMHENGKLNEMQELWFRDTKPQEELYDTWEDPHELVNLAGNPEYVSKINEMSAELIHWQEKYRDMGFIKEYNLFHYFWPDARQPATENPVVKYNNNTILISCETPGANIVYKIIAEGDKKEGPYALYNGPLSVIQNGVFYCRAERYGFKPSNWVKLDLNQAHKCQSKKTDSINNQHAE